MSSSLSNNTIPFANMTHKRSTRPRDCNKGNLRMSPRKRQTREPPPPSFLPLLKLPNELQIMIASVLPVKDIASLVLGNRHLHELLTPTLYSLGCNLVDDIKKETPLHWAAAQPDRLVVAERLLSRGADIEGKTERRLTALHIAAEAGNEDCCELLLEHGADISAPSVTKVTPLHYAAGSNQADVVDLFLRNGAPLLPSERNHTPIHRAVRACALDALNTFLDHDPSLIHSVANGQSLLTYAFHVGGSKGPNPNLLTALIDARININHPTIQSRSALHFAAFTNQHAHLKLLLSRGGNPNLKGSYEGTPLHDAAAQGHVEIAKLLALYGADIDARDVDNSTPLFYAVERGEDAMIRHLEREGADVNACDSYHMTPLARACAQCSIHVHPDIAETLLQLGADVARKDIDGMVALHHAAREGHTPIVRALLKAGARVMVRDNHGDNPLDVAESNSRHDVVKMLRESMGMIGA